MDHHATLRTSYSGFESWQGDQFWCCLRERFSNNLDVKQHKSKRRENRLKFLCCLEDISPSTASVLYALLTELAYVWVLETQSCGFDSHRAHQSFMGVLECRWSIPVLFCRVSTCESVERVTEKCNTQIVVGVNPTAPCLINTCLLVARIEKPSWI